MQDNLPMKGDIVKTKSGTKTWRVLGFDGTYIKLEGVTNFKFKRLSIEQYNKTWMAV